MKRMKKTIKHFMQNSKVLYGLYKWLIVRRRTRTFQRFCRQNPIEEKTILFESFQGRQYTCSPKAMYLAALGDERFSDYTFVWSLRDLKAHSFLKEDPRTRLIRYGSRGYLKIAACAKYWVTNSTMQPYLTPRRGQVFVQTWHGTPLKRLGCDLKLSPNKSQKLSQVHAQYRQQGKKITCFLSPSVFYTEKIASAFALTDEERAQKIIPCGYPRNDRLFSCTPQEIERLKQRLELPPDKKILLYAPTFRDDHHERGKGFLYKVGIDFDRLYRELSADYIVLFRAHYFIINGFDFEKYGGFVRNVSHYDDINDLYLVSDMLLTDYSSVFFDYANLCRPIMFFMYDFEDYKDRLRDFYLEMSELPGPIVYRNEDVCDMIRQTARDFVLDEKYKAFNRRFNTYNDRNSSMRALGACIR